MFHHYTVLQYEHAKWTLDKFIKIYQKPEKKKSNSQGYLYQSVSALEGNIIHFFIYRSFLPSQSKHRVYSSNKKA